MYQFLKLQLKGNTWTKTFSAHLLSFNVIEECYKGLPQKNE